MGTWQLQDLDRQDERTLPEVQRASSKTDGFIKVLQLVQCLFSSGSTRLLLRVFCPSRGPLRASASARARACGRGKEPNGQGEGGAYPQAGASSLRGVPSFRFFMDDAGREDTREKG